MTTEIINKGLPAPFQKHYRPDIDGLRAIAVLSVVAYHFTSGRFHGGFIGVDIFFVISGFLITSNIVEDLDRARFSFLDFYARRIRRIFPALAIILVFTYFVGLLTFNRLNEYFDLYPISPFVRVLGSIAAGAGFSSNLFFWHSTAYFGNYFGETPLSEPLLHLWSLGIEEQFYIVWPLLLYFAHKHKSNYFIAALLIGIVSFGINICTVHQHPVAAFYSPLSRSWELMVGAVLALTPPLGRHVFALGSKQLSVAGLALIAFGLFFVTDTMAFPGWVALLPTLGAACCIAAGPSPWLNRNILGNRAFVWIGLISYPLYLWHWPALYIYEKYATPLISSYDVFRLAKLAALLICVVVSWLTFVLVERPVRFGTQKKKLTVTAFASVAAIGILASLTPSLITLSIPGLSPYQKQTISRLTRVANSEPIDPSDMYGHNPCMKVLQSQTVAMFLKNKCVDIRNPDAKTVFLMGDSHSGSLSLGIRPILQAAKLNFLQVSTGWCEPFSNNAADVTCKEINDFVLDKIAETKPDVVIIDAWWSQEMHSPYFVGSGDFFSYFLKRLEDIKNRGAKKIIVVGQIPIWFPSLPRYLANSYVRNNLPMPVRTFSGVDLESLAIDTKMGSLDYPQQVIYVSLKDALCNDAGCLTMIGPDVQSQLIVWDYGHLTPAAANYLTKRLILPIISSTLSSQMPSQ